ncbi:MAG: hypothetical protein N4J56_007248 [Chroococcidiopsis sp. SAG 2025]|uniref:hypothetical protein n=1 Tax=Chroococcidiopsis sp. SAG 2025 TaxID=171389 RepID=UPI0029373B32|nr:hypothetical protein [Chroococcidiopsis sp. SAG 2025]MDV2997543.1 hypothetical protein [Chroococcidiopsis sp. SAG 2025]
MKGNRTGKGYFQVQGTEPVAKKPLTVKLPVSMDAAVREIAGDRLADWVRDAIAQKLAQEKDLESA